ncbi:hypothetical protein LSTR_LSTR016228 [Laodelphax striatellus]|uniref:Uncharacterized protein n=1 Tax=Laodelphax striatellus TaxID=195883 RepID=A0A482WI22_LAOST|nr:hypothetical protein LSTR_LSTR016228 [Laodelphax striatellus]
MWLPKKRDKGTSQVFTSLNESVLTDMMDPISATDGVNKQYLEKRMNEHSREVVGKVLTVMESTVLIGPASTTLPIHGIVIHRAEQRLTGNWQSGAWSVATSADAGVLEKAAAVAVTNIMKAKAKFGGGVDADASTQNSWTQKGEEIL